LRYTRMLRLDKVFSLKQHILKAIPKTQLQIPRRHLPPNAPNEEIYMDARGCRLSIVGHENDGLILVARDGFYNVSIVVVVVVVVIEMLQELILSRSLAGVYVHRMRRRPSSICTTPRTRRSRLSTCMSRL